MKTGFGLRQVDQILGYAFFLQNAANHVFVFTGANQGALEGATATLGIEIDKSGNLVGHHERQVGGGGLDFGLGLGLNAGVNRRGEFVGFVDWRWFGFLLGEAVALLKGKKFQAIDAIENAVQFFFQAIVGAEVEPAAQQLVEGGIEILLGGFQVSGAVVLLPGLIFLFDTCDQFSNRIGLQGLRNLARGLRFLRARRLLLLEGTRRAADCRQRRGLCPGLGHEGLLLSTLAGKGRRQQGANGYCRKPM